MMNFSKEAMAALAEYVKAFDKCANEPEKIYGTAKGVSETVFSTLKTSRWP